jgi:hypothetical protein
MNRKMLFVSLATIAVPGLPTAAFATDGDLQTRTANLVDAYAADTDIVQAKPELVIDSAAPIASVLPDSAVLATTDDGALSDDDLLQLRGGQAIVVGNQTLTAISNGNAFNGNYIAGGISLTDNALSNFNGLGNLVINTGAQNNLQSAMNVTINFAQ